MGRYDFLRSTRVRREIGVEDVEDYTLSIPRRVKPGSSSGVNTGVCRGSEVVPVSGRVDGNTGVETLRDFYVLFFLSLDGDT